jgi:hypothetical protein
MSSALLGNKSIVSSEMFRYVFPHANVSYMNSLMDSHPNLCHGECAKSSHLMDENNEYAQSCLDAVMEAIWKMMITMSFVEAQTLTKHQMARQYS